MVSWLLEEGTEGDFYDFLELYIRRWRIVARRIRRKCARGRRMEETGTRLGTNRLLETLPLSEVNATDRDPMDVVFRPFFECGKKKFHPYDW